MNVINLSLMRNPLNWIIVLLMVAIPAVSIMLIQRSLNSGN